MSGRSFFSCLILIWLIFGLANCKGLKRSNTEDHTDEQTNVTNSETSDLPRGLTVKTPLDESGEPSACNKNTQDQNAEVTPESDSEQKEQCL